MDLFELCFCLDVFTGVGLLSLFSVFWGNSILFSTVGTTTYIPTETALSCLLSLNKFMVRKTSHKETNFGSIYWTGLKKSVPMSIKLREALCVHNAGMWVKQEAGVSKSQKNFLFIISHSILCTYITDASPWFSLLPSTHHSRCDTVWYIGCNICYD